MPQPVIAPSILSADFARLGAEVEAVLAAGADWVHFDVMDNHYVPNLTIGPLVCSALRKHGVKAPIDVHLMVDPVDPLVPEFAEAGATWISFHPEASRHVDRTIQLIRSSGCRPGIVLNPASSLSWLDHTLDSVDLVLLMSVNPGFGGQKFIEPVLGARFASRSTAGSSRTTSGPSRAPAPTRSCRAARSSGLRTTRRPSARCAQRSTGNKEGTEPYFQTEPRRGDAAVEIGLRPLFISRRWRRPSCTRGRRGP
jgi:ribulose-phosphate 3-epimerase